MKPIRKLDDPVNKIKSEEQKYTVTVARAQYKNTMEAVAVISGNESQLSKLYCLALTT